MELRTFRTCAISALFATTTAAFAEVSDSPWCDMIEDGEDWKICALQAENLVLDFTYEGETVVFRQLQIKDGQGTVTSSNTLEAWSRAPFPPGLRDVNGDDVPELFIPLGAGNVNIEYAVFEFFNEEFVPRGTVLGGTVEGFEVRDNLLITSTRNTAYSYTEEALHVSSHGMANVYTIDTDFSREAGSYCEMSQSYGLGAYGLNEADLLADCEKAAAKALE